LFVPSAPTWGPLQGAQQPQILMLPAPPHQDYYYEQRPPATRYARQRRYGPYGDGGRPYTLNE